MVFRHAFASCALVLIAFFAVPANADVVWNWQFGTESGTFITSGTFADTSAAGTFTISQFHVTGSAYPGAAGAHYDLGSQLPEGMIWDGSVATQFFRDVYTNGANFYGSSTPPYRYVLIPAQGIIEDDDENILASAALTVTPVRDVVAAAPVAIPSLLLSRLLLLGTLLAGAALLLLRRRRNSTAA